MTKEALRVRWVWWVWWVWWVYFWGRNITTFENTSTPPLRSHISSSQRGVFSEITAPSILCSNARIPVAQVGIKNTCWLECRSQGSHPGRVSIFLYFGYVSRSGRDGQWGSLLYRPSGEYRNNTPNYITPSGSLYYVYMDSWTHIVSDCDDFNKIFARSLFFHFLPCVGIDKLLGCRQLDHNTVRCVMQVWPTFVPSKYTQETEICTHTRTHKPHTHMHGTCIYPMFGITLYMYKTTEAHSRVVSSVLFITPHFTHIFGVTICLSM